MGVGVGARVVGFRPGTSIPYTAAPASFSVSTDAVARGSWDAKLAVVQGPAAVCVSKDLCLYHRCILLTQPLVTGLL